MCDSTYPLLQNIIIDGVNIFTYLPKSIALGTELEKMG